MTHWHMTMHWNTLANSSALKNVTKVCNMPLAGTETEELERYENNITNGGRKTLRRSTNDNILHITEGVGRWQATNVHPDTSRSYSPVENKQFRQPRQFTEPQPPTTNNGSWHIHPETGRTKRYSGSGRRNSSSSKAYGCDYCSGQHSRNRIPFTGSLWPGWLHSWRCS